VSGVARPGPYACILGEAYLSLDPAVRRAHEPPLRAQGTLIVEHGSHWWTPLLIFAMRLPAAGPAQPVRLEVARHGSALTWSRRIGSSPLRTVQFAEGSCLVERSGIGRITFELTTDRGTLRYRQRALHIARVRVPRVVCPQVQASVSAAGGDWRVSVEVTWRGWLVCRYAGIISAV
jgi:hypothetical protein